MSEPAKLPTHARSLSGRILTWWFGLMAAAGVVFGVYAEDRPFGDDVLEHPLVVFFAGVAVALLLVRFVLRRPVPELIPDRLLIFGCVVGLAAFLIGNWLSVHLAAIR
jgi:hypothetical protein